MIRCTFAGHRDVVGLSIADIMSVLEEIIQQTNSDIECLVGGMGNFDTLAASAVRRLQKKYRSRHISLILVLPYFQHKINENKSYYEEMFDVIILPSELEGVHYKRAIGLRNRWMVDQSDYLIFMVQREYGGAYEMLKYAYKKNIKVIDLSGE